MRQMRVLTGVRRRTPLPSYGSTPHVDEVEAPVARFERGAFWIPRGSARATPLHPVSFTELDAALRSVGYVACRHIGDEQLVAERDESCHCGGALRAHCLRRDDVDAYSSFAVCKRCDDVAYTF